MENNNYAVYGNVDIVTGKTTFVGTKEQCEEERQRNIVIEILRESYDIIIEILKKYLDLREEYYSLITLWILGTYLHKEFESYPYLFFNAMRGSGKSRAIRLICELSNGNVMASPTEAVLFRTTGTLGIDEFEGVASKDKATIRELLNGAYKKGIKIMRMKKKKSLTGEEQVVEEFEPYRPIVMANINGMDEVLGDRCLTLVLEKSNHPVKTRLIEDFSNEIIQNVKKKLIQCSLCGVVMKKNIYKSWNNYTIDRHDTTLYTHILHNTPTTQTTIGAIKLDKIFNKIYETEIIGRNLELMMPIFFIADLIHEDIFNNILQVAKNIVIEKKGEEEIESIDVMVYNFISKQDEGLLFNSVKELTNSFREFSNESYEWLNAKWFGRALKRLNLVINKRRINSGVEVMLNVQKAKEKLKIFQNIKPKDDPQ